MRQKNWDKQVAADSHIKWDALNEKQKKERNTNNKQVKKSSKRKLKRCEQLKKDLDNCVSFGGDHQTSS